MDYGITVDEQGLHRITMHLPGYGSIRSPGDPDLPETILEFKVPLNIDWTTVRLQIESEKPEPVEGRYDIAPAQPYTVRDRNEWGYGKSTINGRNILIYGNDSFYPQKSLVMLPYTEKKVPFQDRFEKTKLVRVAFRPFLYNPVKRELKLNKQTVFRITYELLPGELPGGEGKDGVSAAFYDYAIITTNEIVSNSKVKN